MSTETFAGFMGPGCCEGGGPPPPPCVLTVTILDGTTLDPISGAGVVIKDHSGTTVCSGDTDGSGVFTCSLDPIPVLPSVTATAGDCTYTGPIACVPLTLYQCEGSVAYEAIDDAGGEVSGILFSAAPSGPYARVVSMTGGTTSFAGSMISTTPGTAVFCWFGPTRPPSLPTGFGSISHGPLDPTYPAGTGINHGNETYWETCKGTDRVGCGDSTYYPVYYRKSLWLAMPCCKTGCVDHTNAIPKTLCVTIDGPSEIFGSDAGESITLDWDTSSWDGDDTTTVTTGPFGTPVLARMVFGTGCLGGNGAGGYCYSTNSSPGCNDFTQGTFVPYGSHKVTLTIGPTRQINGFAADCTAGLSYQNYWGDGCPSPDPAPCVCPPSALMTKCPPGVLDHTLPIPPLYCPTAAIDPCTGAFFGGHFPMSVGFILFSTGDIAGSFKGCEPVDWANAVTSFPSGWQSTCTKPYDPTFGESASCVVDSCGASPPEDPTGPAMMMMSGPRGPAMAAERINPRATLFPDPAPPDGRLRVGWVEPCAFLGGAEIHTERVMALCDPDKVRWEGIAIRHEPDIPMIPTVLNSWEKHCPVRVGRKAIRELARRVDVLMTWGIPSAFLERLLPPDLPVIEISHCAVDDATSHSLCSMPRSKTVAVSESALKGIPPARRASSRVIHNSVSPERVKPTRSRAEMLAEWGLPPDARVIGWLSRLSEEKRPRPWVDGVARLPGNWWGVMVGAGLDAEATKAYAAKVAPGRIVFPGPTTDVGSAFGAMDCMVMTTRAEGCCYAIAEAQLAGIPVISPAVGLLEEWPDLARILPMEVTGQDVAVAVMRDWHDPEGTEARAEKAKQFVAANLSDAKFRADWCGLIASTAATKPPPAPRPGSIDPAIRDAVLACPERGPSPLVPLEAEKSCCGGWTEAHECRAGKGKVPGRVTLRECLTCKTP